MYRGGRLCGDAFIVSRYGWTISSEHALSAALVNPSPLGPGIIRVQIYPHIAARSFGRKCARERRRYYKQGEAHGFYKDCKQSNLGSGKLVGKMRKEEPRQDERGGKDREGWPRRPSMRDKEERAERRYRTEPDTTLAPRQIRAPTRSSGPS